MTLHEPATVNETLEPADIPLVSVIIPVHNGRDRLPVLLEALNRQTADPRSYEIIFVDDRSSDGTPAMIRAAGGARVLVTPSRGGAYAARNLGLSQARGHIYAFTDSDCVPAPDWIEQGLTQLDAVGADLLAGRVDIVLGRRPSLAALVDAWRFLDQRRWARQGFGATANLWVRREVFDRVGLFNSQLISGGDAEFGHRATGAAFQLRYAHEVVVLHPPRDKARELARKAFRQGYGAAQQTRYAEGPMGRQGRPWLEIPRYIPRDRVRELSRLRDQGYHPSRLERVGMFWVTYLALKLPYLFGNFAGDVAEAARR